MRYLKNKIFRARELTHKRSFDTLDTQIRSSSICDEPSFHDYPASVSSFQIIDETLPNSSTLVKPPKINQPKPRVRQSSAKTFPKATSSTKNIAINYGKAISSFALSSLAVPYLQTFIDEKTIDLAEFIRFVSQAKESIGGIAGLRGLLLTHEEDDLKMTMCKKAFKAVSEVFIKYFSVNWIIHGRVTHKLVYLKYRSKMLRRIQNPELFTYVSRSSVKKADRKDL